MTLKTRLANTFCELFTRHTGKKARYNQKENKVIVFDESGTKFMFNYNDKAKDAMIKEIHNSLFKDQDLDMETKGNC